LSACGGESAPQGRIALQLGIEEVGKMPTLLEDTGGTPALPYEEAASSSYSNNP
jgi:hypothetical protein